VAITVAAAVALVALVDQAAEQAPGPAGIPAAPALSQPVVLLQYIQVMVQLVGVIQAAQAIPARGVVVVVVALAHKADMPRHQIMEDKVVLVE
jgi:hypothetical protein